MLRYVVQYFAPTVRALVFTHTDMAYGVRVPYIK